MDRISDWISFNWDGLKLLFKAVGVAMTAYALITGGYNYFTGLNAISKLGRDRSAAFEKWIGNMHDDAAQMEFVAAERRLHEQLPAELAKTLDGAIQLTTEVNSMHLNLLLKSASR